jgi:HK97 family phage prohead protease
MTNFITAAEYKAARLKGAPTAAIVRKDGAAELVDAGTTDDRRVTFVVSTAAVDRDNDTIAVEGWVLDDYRRNPVVLWAHDDQSLPIAKATDVGPVGNRLIATFEFVPADMPVIGPHAEAVLRMLRSGFLAATSVGFKPIDAEFSDDPDRRGGMDFSRQSLFEISVVPVPSNPEALAVAPPVGPDVEARGADIAAIKLAKVRRARRAAALGIATTK